MCICSECAEMLYVFICLLYCNNVLLVLKNQFLPYILRFTLRKQTRFSQLCLQRVVSGCNMAGLSLTENKSSIKNGHYLILSATTRKLITKNVNKQYIYVSRGTCTIFSCQYYDNLNTCGTIIQWNQRS